MVCQNSGVERGGLAGGFVRQPAKDKFLGEIRGRSLSCADQEISQQHSDTAIGCWIVGIGDGSRGQIAADGRVVRLRPSIVSSTHEGARDGVEKARPRGPRALVEVARILVQKRQENSATDHDVGKAVGVSGAIALTEALPTLGVVG